MKKIVAFLLVGIALIFFMFFYVCGFKVKPTPSIFFSENPSKLSVKYDPVIWKIQDGSIQFINGSSRKGKISVNTNDLPSENKYPGYVTMSVRMKGDFKNLPANSLYGFQIGNTSSTEKDHIVIGLSGEGIFKAFDGNLDSLTKEKINTQREENTILKVSKEIELSLHYYKNPYGWIVFVSASDYKDHKERVRTFLNYIPFTKLSSPDKEISLIAFNPSTNGKISFSEWKIFNDWKPND